MLIGGLVGGAGEKWFNYEYILKVDGPAVRREVVVKGTPMFWVRT